MIVIGRKKLLSVLGIITMIICAYITTSVNIKTSLKNDAESIATVALPVDSKVIIIDAGHGVPDEGAESSTRNN